MKNLCQKLSLALLAGLWLPVAAQAGGKIKPREPYKPVYDVIQAVDTAGSTVTIGHVNSKDTSTKVYKVDSNTDIQVNGEKATLADVKTGMKVSLTIGFDEDKAGGLSLSPAPPDPTPYPTPKK